MELDRFISVFTGTACGLYPETHEFSPYLHILVSLRSFLILSHLSGFSPGTLRRLKTGTLRLSKRRDPFTHWHSAMSKKNGILNYRSAKTAELTFLRVFCAKFVNVLTICVQNWTAPTTVMFVVIAKAGKVHVCNLGSACQCLLNLYTKCYQFTVSVPSKLRTHIPQSLVSYVTEHSFLKSWWPIRRPPPHHWALFEPAASNALLHTLFLRPVLILYKALCAWITVRSPCILPWRLKTGGEV